MNFRRDWLGDVYFRLILFDPNQDLFSKVSDRRNKAGPCRKSYEFLDCRVNSGIIQGIEIKAIRSRA